MKTDRVDVLTLANLLRADFLPEITQRVPVPPLHVRELRALLSHRRRLVSLQTTAKNRLRSVLHRLNVPAPKGKPFSQKNRAFWTQLQLSSIERLRVEQELRQASTSQEWAEHMAYLLQVPGVGLITAMTILAAVGEIERFGSAKQLVGYAGLGAVCMPAARSTATRVSPNRAGATCAR